MNPARLRWWGALAALACSAGLPGPVPGATLYDNTGNPADAYYVGQGGSEAIDDLHLVSPAELDTLTFECFEPVAGSYAASATLYANPGGLDLATMPLAGPFVATGLRSGRSIVSIPLPAGLLAAADLWVGVRFTSATAGLILNDTPSVGGSHDLYLEDGAFYWFGGSPRANFGIRLVGRPAVAAVDEAAAPAVALAPPAPNPFRGATTLAYSLDRPGPVRIDVCDVAGRHVRSLIDGVRGPGAHTATWTGRDDAGRLMPPGVYLVRLVTAAGTATRRVVFAP